MDRTDSTQAMKNILSAYGEDDEIIEDDDHVDDVHDDDVHDDDDRNRPEDNISNSEDEEPHHSIPVPVFKRDIDDGSSQDNTPIKAKIARAGPTTLVSYGRDVEDEDMEDESSDEDEQASGGMKLVDYDLTMIHADNDSEIKSSNGSHHNIELPPEPTERCSNKLQEKILKLYQKMRSGMDLNASIQNRKDFRNPSIYEKLISYCNIDEKGTNYPPELYNPTIWGKESFYDELAKAQKVDMDRREKERKERTKVEFVTGTKKQTPEGTVVEQKRKSKWDSQSSSTVSKPIVITTSAINPPAVSVSSSSSAVKTSVISATGSLKKPK